MKKSKTDIFPETSKRNSSDCGIDDKSFLHVSTSDANNEKDTIAYLSKQVSPLIVSLHTWSGCWKEADPLAEPVKKLGWNYIHPNFKGPNDNEAACLSDYVIEDIDRAIGYAIDKGKVDMRKIIIIGESGGGYTALGYRLKGKYSIKHTFAWVPITDLENWYYQSRMRQNKYADDILGCVGGTFDKAKLVARSPLYFDENNNGFVTLYAGIDDGYSGSVPISHSLNYFNKVAASDDKINSDLLVKLLTKGCQKGVNKLGDRDVYLDRVSGSARVVVFNGGHEMLISVAMSDIQTTLKE